MKICKMKKAKFPNIKFYFTNKALETTTKIPRKQRIFI